jgi:hypothetical protein
MYLSRSIDNGFLAQEEQKFKVLKVKSKWTLISIKPNLLLICDNSQIVSVEGVSLKHTQQKDWYFIH